MCSLPKMKLYWASCALRIFLFKVVPGSRSTSHRNPASQISCFTCKRNSLLHCTKSCHNDQVMSHCRIHWHPRLVFLTYRIIYDASKNIWVPSRTQQVSNGSISENSSQALPFAHTHRMDLRLESLMTVWATARRACMNRTTKLVTVPSCKRHLCWLSDFTEGYHATDHLPP